MLTPTHRQAIQPGAWLGMLGGGQLGRMFCFAAHSLGYRVLVLDPDAESPAGAVADEHVCAAYNDPQALTELAGRCAAITTEFENVPAETLAWLAERTVVAPNAQAVSIAQDRIEEKRFFQSCGLSVAPYAVLRHDNECDALPDNLFPGILKTARFGYDGKAQIRVADRSAACAAFVEMGRVPCVLEKMLPLADPEAFEISVVGARGYNGLSATFPVAENVHHRGILSVSTLPSPRANAALKERAQQAALRIAEQLHYVGVFCVEFFVLPSGELVVNEMAPRPHNSGHATLDACVTSQFEQQVRALVGLPLGDTRQHSPTVMLNLLGEACRSPSPWGDILNLPGVKLHLYGKNEPRPGRKMGHINCVASSLAEARAYAALVSQRLNLDSDPANLAPAIRRLLDGDLVAFPTETVYGLGADAKNPLAVKKIFNAKGRPTHHPVIVHIAHAHALDQWAIDIPEEARRLAQTFWPGPLTLVLKRAPRVDDSVTGGQDTVGLRCPAHPLAQALLSALDAHGTALAAPSANLFGHISPTSAAHVAADFPNMDLTILDGGSCQVGIESTIVDFSRGAPVLLRPGVISTAMIETVLGTRLGETGLNAPRVSGALASHYAPRKPLTLSPADDIRQMSADMAHQTALLYFSAVPTHRLAWSHQAPCDPTIYAQHLYTWLRDMDASSATHLIIETPPSAEAWSAVNDRLNKASTVD